MPDQTLAAAMRARGGVLVHVDDASVVAHFGDAAAEYAAMRDGAAVVELPWIERLRVTGGDRVGFLQGMLSNDVASLTAGSGCHALLLNEQGKTIGDLVVLAGDDAIALDGVGSASTVRAALERFVVADDVELLPAPSTCVLAVLGPRAREVMTRLGLPAPAAAYAHGPTTIPDADPHVVRIAAPGVGGFLCRVPGGEAEAWWERLADAGARPAGLDAFDVLRIESGVPRHGRDVHVDTLALEAPYEDAISFRKGCYLGQEVMERVTARGHVNRKLVGIEVDGDVPSVRDAHLFAGDRDVGWVTSAAHSWRLARTIGLAYVRREHLAPGTALALGAPNGPAVIVRTLPF